MSIFRASFVVVVRSQRDDTGLLRQTKSKEQIKYVHGPHNAKGPFTKLRKQLQVSASNFARYGRWGRSCRWGFKIAPSTLLLCKRCCFTKAACPSLLARLPQRRPSIPVEARRGNIGVCDSWQREPPTLPVVAIALMTPGGVERCATRRPLHVYLGWIESPRLELDESRD